jgi:hypothetical protein
MGRSKDPTVNPDARNTPQTNRKKGWARKTMVPALQAALFNRHDSIPLQGDKSHPSQQSLQRGNHSIVAVHPVLTGQNCRNHSTKPVLAGAAGLEPATCGFGDRRSTN